MNIVELKSWIFPQCSLEELVENKMEIKRRVNIGYWIFFVPVHQVDIELVVWISADLLLALDEESGDHKCQ